MKTQNLPSCDRGFLIRQTRLMLSSYRHWTGQSLWPEDRPDETLIREVFFAPFVLCSSGTEADPVLNYGNQKGLDLWEMDWDTLTRTPGRQTAEPVEQEQREGFLKAVREKGHVTDYRGIRISSSGRRFEIRKATVWNLIHPDGVYAGQAATFLEWKYLDA